MAAEKLNGSSIGGRRVIVEVAAKASDRPQAKPSIKRKRPLTNDDNAEGAIKDDEEKGDNVDVKQPAKNLELSTLHLVPSAANRSTVLALFGFPARGEGLLKARLWKRVKKTEGAIKMEYPVQVEGSEGVTVALVTYSSPHVRAKAIKALDGKSIHGHLMAAKPSEEYVNPKAAQLNCRLIVRNLRFDATAAHLRSALKRHAPALAPLVTDIHIPVKDALKGGMTRAEEKQEEMDEAAKDEDDDDEEEEEEEEEEDDIGNVKVKKEVLTKPTAPLVKNRGFAFLQFAVKSAADAAIVALNEKRVHKRTVAVDKSVSKEEFKSAAVAKAKAATAAVAIAEGPKEGGALDENKNADSKDEEKDNDDKNDDKKDDEKDDDPIAKDEEEEEKEEEEEEKAPVESPESLGATLFLRNVAFDTDEKELIATFRLFGPVHYATIVKDRDSGRPKGTAFVKFYVKVGADRALAAASAPDEHMSDFRTVKENESHTESRRRETYAEAVDKALLNDGGIKCGDRLLLVRRALSKEEAATLAAQKLAQTKGVPGKKLYDKRHTYLANEGHIRDGSEAAEHCPKADLLKRDEARKTKKKKLESPLFFVSPTRLSIRNLARHVNDASLRTLARDAAYAGVQSELIDVTGKGEGDPALMPTPGTSLQPRVEVITARVLRESIEEAGGAGAGGRIARARLEPDGVTARSKGFGFIEFSTHLHALACLRELNNNPAYSTAFAAGGATAKTRPEDEWPRLIVEFAIENIAKVKEHEKRKAEMKARRDSLAAAGVQQPFRPQQQQQPQLQLYQQQQQQQQQQQLLQLKRAKRGYLDPLPVISNKSSDSQTGARQHLPSSSQQQLKRPQEMQSSLDVVGGRNNKRGRSEGEPRGAAQALHNSDEAELEAILNGLDEVGWGEEKKERKKKKTTKGGVDDTAEVEKPRRVGRKSEKAEEDEHDKMVSDYKKKLFGL